MLFHTTGNHIREILEESRRKTILLDFYAPWCAPCRTLEPILDRLADHHELTMTAYSINADTDPELLERFGVSVLPTVLFLRNGQVIQTFDHAISEEALKEWMEAHC